MNTAAGWLVPSLAVDDDDNKTKGGISNIAQSYLASGQVPDVQVVHEGDTGDLEKTGLNLFGVNVGGGAFHQNTKTVPNKTVGSEHDQCREEHCANRVNNSPRRLDHDNNRGNQHSLFLKNEN